jgi:(p)ppGpp synthase/HD superfamily hydrolase
MRPDGLCLVTHAADFAARRHSELKRKGAAGEPYINHLIEVADLLASATEGRDPALVAAGYLHDTLEDTATTKQELAAYFGSDVAALVLEVTDDKRLPKAERKRLQIVKAADKTERARLLKVADKISNLRALALSPPAGWPIERRSEYVDWAEAVVASCRGLNVFLDNAFDRAIVDVRAAIADRIAEQKVNDPR